MVFVARIARRRATHPPRLPKRERAGVARRRRRRGRCGCRFDAAPDAFDFFRTRPRSHAERPLRVWARSGAFRARAARRAAATGDDAGVEVFSFLFFSSPFFFRGSSTPGPGETWIAVGTCGRPVAPARESAAATRETRRNTRPTAVTAALARAPRSRRPRRPPDRRVTRQQIPRTYLFSRSASGFFHERRF